MNETYNGDDKVDQRRILFSTGAAGDAPRLEKAGDLFLHPKTAASSSNGRDTTKPATNEPHLLKIGGLQPTGTANGTTTRNDDKLGADGTPKVVDVKKASADVLTNQPAIPTEISIRSAASMIAADGIKRTHQDEGIEANKKRRTKADDQLEQEIDGLDLTVCSDDESVQPGEQGMGTYKSTDVLCGRGGSINVHPANVKFRKLIDQHRKAYLQARKTLKPLMNRAIVHIVRRNYGGRFLKQEEDGLWFEIGDVRAQEKVGQAFRQKAPEMRKLLFKDQDFPGNQVSQEHLRLAQQEQQRQQREQQQLLEQRHRQQLEQQIQQQQIQQQQIQQQQMALAAATQGAIAVDPTTFMLTNPLLLQQAAMTNPFFNMLMMMNNGIAPGVNLAVNPALPLPTAMPAPPPMPANNDAIMMNNGIAPGVNLVVNPAVPLPTAAVPAPPAPANNDAIIEQLKQAAAAFTGNGGYIQPQPPPPPRGPS